MAGTVASYREIVQQLLTQYAQIPNAHDDLADETIFDQETDRYLLLTFGWQGRKRINVVVLHLDIRDGQIWIQCNNTDQDIVAELIAAGVDAADIVLAYALEAERASVHALAA